MSLAAFIASARKALIGGLGTAGVAIVKASEDGAISNAEWGTAALAFLGGAILVYFTPNTPATPAPYVGEHQAP